LSALILDGRALAREIAEKARQTALARQREGRTQPAIAVVRVGEDPASLRYAQQIQRTFAGAALGFRLVALPSSASENQLASCLRSLGEDPSVTGILLQLPLPGGLSEEAAATSLVAAKDVDGINPLNAGRLFLGRGRYFAPATPLGGIELLERSGVKLSGRHAVVVGRSAIVGRPLAMLLLHRHATVTICHSRTADLARFTRQGEILAVAVGQPGLITGEMVAPGAVVLDFGTSVVDGKLVGDVDFDSVEPVAGAITPVPGGTGPLTNAMLLANTIAAAEWQEQGE
jgi:methylenetetrahydrofolate dehydrogenase (NADP+) / methenyltetrahydrofolate cyclohydrolase